MVPEGEALTRAEESLPGEAELNAAAADGGEDAADAAEGEPEVVEETEENAQKLFESGCDALKCGDYVAAGDDLCKSLEIRTKIYGELAPECATVYYKYGCSLLYKVQSERDILSEPKEKGGADTEAPEAEGDGATEGAPANEAGDDEGEDIEDEEESDLELAWKMMDIARVIHEKQHTHSLEEVDVISGLADISLEKEDFNTCYEDYSKALEILMGIVESDNRRLAELYFKMALAKQLAKTPTNAIEYCHKAITVCESRLERLKRELQSEQQEIIRSSKEDEIKEMEALAVDLKEKIEELHQMEAAPPLLEALQRDNPEVVETMRMAFKAAADAAAASNGAKSEGAPSTSTEIHLGVVGRGIKRAAPVPITENGNGKKALTEENHPASS